MPTQSLAWGRGLRILGLVALLGGGVLQLSVTAGAQQTGPTITVTPAGPAFQDGQKVSVSFSGFRPNFDLQIRQCTPNPRSGDDCDLLTQDFGRTNAGGSGTLPDFVVRKLPRPAPLANSGVVCNDTVACVIVVSEDLNDFTLPKASSGPIKVSAATPPPVVPEVPWAVALPLTALGLGLGAWQVGRRRQPSPLAG